MKIQSQSSLFISCTRNKKAIDLFTALIGFKISNWNSSVPDQLLFGPPGSGTFPILAKVLCGQKLMLSEFNISTAK